VRGKDVGELGAYGEGAEVIDLVLAALSRQPPDLGVKSCIPKRGLLWRLADNVVMSELATFRRKNRGSEGRGESGRRREAPPGGGAMEMPRLLGCSGSGLRF